MYHISDKKTGSSLVSTSNSAKIGFYASVLVALLTAITFLTAILTPPLSGPLCSASCFSYPFSDIASRFPRDYYWMYPAMLLFGAYIVLMVSIHALAPQNKKIFSQIGLIFATIASAVLIVDFFLQITVIQPSLINGEMEGIAMLTQFNSHGIFIALEELGYILVSIASLFMAIVFSGSTLAKSIRFTYFSMFFLTILAFGIISFQYGISREYVFEIAAITINWLGIIISSILLAFFFKRSIADESSETIL
jgi:hypothetical protein